MILAPMHHLEFWAAAPTLPQEVDMEDMLRAEILLTQLEIWMRCAAQGLSLSSVKNQSGLSKRSAGRLISTLRASGIDCSNLATAPACRQTAAIRKVAAAYRWASTMGRKISAKRSVRSRLRGKSSAGLEIGAPKGNAGNAPGRIDTTDATAIAGVRKSSPVRLPSAAAATPDAPLAEKASGQTENFTLR